MPRVRAGHWAGVLLLGALLALLIYHVAGVLLDFGAVLRFPFQLDYGEGIVWQQAALMLSHRAYSAAQDLPFVVFHYPPVYYLATRAVDLIAPDMLMAGRLVSMASTLALVPLIAAFVLAATRPAATGARWTIAVAAGLLALCLHAVRNWGLLMRVDMLAIALGLLGAYLGARAQGRFAGTTVALLVCLVSVFTKQTQLPAGIAVFVVALLCNWRGAIGAALVAGGVGVGVVAALQWATSGGFLLNIVFYNLENTFTLLKMWQVAFNERSSLPFAIIMVAGAVGVLVSLLRGGALRGWGAAEPARVARAVLLLYVALAGALLINVGKGGASFNYFLDTFGVGSALIGVALCDARLGTWRFAAAAAILVIGLLNLPFRQLSSSTLDASARDLAPLVARIAAADKPVASEDMTLLMRAGKPVIFEPAITQELIAVGRWDPRPLFDMVRNHGFAFMITLAPQRAIGGPALTAAMLQAYPSVQEAAPGLYLHLPPD